MWATLQVLFYCCIVELIIPVYLRMNKKSPDNQSLLKSRNDNRANIIIS